MAGLEPSDPQRRMNYRGEHNALRRDHLNITAEAGRYMEDLSIDIIERGVLDEEGNQRYEVRDRQVQLPDDYFVTGHPDGRLHRAGAPDDSVSLEDGLVWGFEHKFLGRFKYLKIFKEGFEAGAPDYLSQIIIYGHALGWDKCLAVLVAQDASGVQMEANRALQAKKRTSANSWPLRDDWHPKVMTIAVDLRPYYGLIPNIGKRADDIARIVKEFGPGAVVREGDGIQTRTDRGIAKLNFPCGYCDYATMCNQDGNGTEQVAPVPPALKEG